MSTTVGLMANLNASSSALSKSLERLSTGRRINKSSDDPSGTGQMNYAKGQTGGLRMANESLEEAYCFLKIRAAAMDEVQDAILRIRDLAVRASSDATLTDTQRANMTTEAEGLVDSINLINDTTKFAGKKVFDVGFDQVPGGFSAFNHPGKKTLSVDLAAYAALNGGVATITSAWYDGAAAFPDMNLLSPDGTEAFGYLYVAHGAGLGVEVYEGGPGAQTVNFGDPDGGGLPAGTMNTATQVQYSGYTGAAVGTWVEETFTVTNPQAGMWTIIIDNEAAAPRYYGIFVNEPAVDPNPHDVVMTTANNVDTDTEFHLGQYEVDSLAVGVSSAMSTVSAALQTLSGLDSALFTLGKRQTDNNALMSTVEKLINENNVQIMNIEGFRSRIEDADMAGEVTSFARSSIIAKSSANMITANTDRLRQAASMLIGSI